MQGTTTGSHGWPLDARELGIRVKAKREAEGLSLRAAAALLAMSAATISRVEGGSHLPERDHLLKLARWAGIRLDAYPDSPQGDVHGEEASTLEAVELHLRADKDLAAEDAELLIQLVRTAYDRMSGRHR